MDSLALQGRSCETLNFPANCLKYHTAEKIHVPKSGTTLLVQIIQTLMFWKEKKNIRKIIQMIFDTEN